MNDYYQLASTNSSLMTYKYVNTIAFLALITVTLIAVRLILRLGNEMSGKKRFIELEKDYKWRRLKVAYLITGAFVMLIVIALSYGPGEIAPLQTRYDFELEKAEASLTTITHLFLTITILWLIYRFLLPLAYRGILRIKVYLQKP
jgi:hypothetical protein